MQKSLYVTLLLMLMVIPELSAAQASNIWRRAYVLGRTRVSNFWNRPMGQLRYASTMPGAKKELSEMDQKILDRARNAMRQKDWQTLEETKKFIISRDPKSPLLEMINQEAPFTQESMGAWTKAGDSSKQGSSTSYQKANEAKAGMGKGSTTGNLSEENFNIQAKINKANAVLNNKSATLEEIKQAEEQMWKLRTIVEGLDALKGEASPLSESVKGAWSALYSRQKSYRSPSEKIGDINKIIIEQEQKLDEYVNQLKTVGSYFENPTVATMEKIKTAHATAEKALKISRNIDSNRAFANRMSHPFREHLKNTESLSKLEDQLGKLYDGLEAIKNYSNGRYQEKGLGEALQLILYEIEPSLGLLNNPQAKITEVEKLYMSLIAVGRIEKALKVLQDIQQSEKTTWSFNPFSIFSPGSKPATPDFKKLRDRADRLHDGLKISKGENISTTFEQRKSKINNILTIFDNKNITLEDVEKAQNNAFELLKLSEALDAVHNREMSKETGKIDDLWRRLYKIEQALKEFEGKEFYEFLSSSRSEIAKSITDIVPV